MEKYKKFLNSTKTKSPTSESEATNLPHNGYGCM